MSVPDRSSRVRYAGLALLLVGLLVVMVSPPVTARVKAVALAGEAIGVGVPRPFATPVSRVEVRIDGVLGDLYAGEDAAPAMILLPGATPAGRDDSRAVAVAEAVARSGRTVFVPELSLYDRRIDEADLDRIVDAALALPDHFLGEGPASIVGFSYGGSYGMLAAADPRLAGGLAQVATFGAYWDLVGIIQAATTGASIVEGERLDWAGDPRAEDLLVEHTLPLVPEDERDALASAVAGDADPSELSPHTRAMHTLLTNDDPTRTDALAERLGPDARRVLDRFSPSTAAADIDAPLVAVHDVDDPAVPYAEALRLQRDRPDARVLTVELFDHVDFEGRDLLEAAPDLWRIWRFAGWVLAAQERWR